MIAEIGHYALVLALALALVQATLPVIGARLNDRVLMGTAEPGESPNAVEIVGSPTPQQATLPLYLTVADFP